MKGLVMRVLSERLRDRELDLTDGIKVFEDRGWAQVLPDPDEPVVHIYAEGKTSEDSQALESDLHGLVEEILQADQAPVGSAGP
jgi:mannose-1-phosphate guanylyltransferase/phosphomannomutase